MERERDQGWLILVALIALSVLVIVSYAMTAPLANWKSPRQPWRSFALIVGALCGWQNAIEPSRRIRALPPPRPVKSREPTGFECCIEKHESISLNSAGGKSDG
jgi:hypothetical protein